jgi:hypothetical protein
MKDEYIMLTESDRAFFQPKWRRVAATLFCIAWSIVEWISNEPIWAMIAAGITAYCLWSFFYKFDDSKDSSPE